jgi:hypothetical protein
LPIFERFDTTTSLGMEAPRDRVSRSNYNKERERTYVSVRPF